MLLYLDFLQIHNEGIYEDDKFTTILADCGGIVAGKSKCGFRPLVIGKPPNCPQCGFLICPQDDLWFL